jgi:hypothetical protein
MFDHHSHTGINVLISIALLLLLLSTVPLSWLCLQQVWRGRQPRSMRQSPIHSPAVHLQSRPSHTFDGGTT